MSNEDELTSTEDAREGGRGKRRGAALERKLVVALNLVVHKASAGTSNVQSSGTSRFTLPRA